MRCLDCLYFGILYDEGGGAQRYFKKFVSYDMRVC